MSTSYQLYILLLLCITAAAKKDKIIFFYMHFDVMVPAVFVSLDTWSLVTLALKYHKGDLDIGFISSICVTVHPIIHYMCVTSFLQN